MIFARHSGLLLATLLTAAVPAFAASPASPVPGGDEVVAQLNPGAASDDASSDAESATAASETTNADVPVPEDPVARTLYYAHQIWQYELFNTPDGSVKVNQLVIALLVLLIGWPVARLATGILRRRIQKWSRIDRNTAEIFQNVAFYFLLVILAFVALPIAGIPITVFTVLGGALAIGIGFGAQNLCNNFISSLILMTERPIRVGDVVEVDDQLGQVESIRGRCTRVNRSDGVDVLVPNSQFLENTLINWTLTNRLIRGSVEVGVAYGSPTDRVHEVLSEVLGDNEKVLADPEPFVLFDGFGDSSLEFEAYFWTHARRPMDVRRVASELRFEIDRRFRESDVIIAFPQRDVHLDSLSPLRVRVESSDGGERDENEP